MILRKFLLITLLIIVGISAGCSNINSKESDSHSVAIHAVVLKNTMWVKRQNLDEFVDVAINNYSSSKIQQMLRNKEIFLVNKDTQVVRYEGNLPEGIVSITFEEGEYRNQTGYARASQVIPEEEYFQLR